MTRIFLASLPLLALAACGGGDSTGKSTTKLDAVEVQPGSISDSMIVLDNVAGDGTAVDNSIPEDETKKDAPKAEEVGESDEAASDADDNPEAVDLPAAKKSVAADGAAKKGE
ncbi:hypothetical protein E5675_12225 [Sphingopyxis sp. PAMC25046]|uniref:hypothetical protein n=1 Tax=Sphingopyxis sp. PAMC25046 TaxID=2565556 RepID=UPI00109E18BD|nr:hypothetical protein [Sphingopyxis sp. PAMC25046]QCB55120.1 hypothetical protein E5675_12225 [Sphingopyxis sp. PAMC25046]